MSRPRILRDVAEVQAPGFAAVSKEDLRSLGSKRRTLSPKDVLLEQAEELKAKAMEDGKAEGFAAGFEAGVSAGRMEGERQAFEASIAAYEQEIAAFVRDLDEVAARVSVAMDKWYDSAEDRIASIVTQVAQRVLHTELATNPEAIIGIVRNALQEIGASRKARIRINPFDLPAVTEHKEALIAGASGLRTLEIVEDPSLSGGCVVESESGVIDASLHTMEQLLEDRAA